VALVAARYALRSTGRNARRTALAVVGIAVGCALALFSESFNRGRNRLYARAVVENGVGHLRVVPAGWQASREPKLRLADAGRAAAAARALPGAQAVGGRARVQALLAMGSRVVAVEAIGVDAEAEPRLDRIVRKLEAGRWLLPGERGAAVVGKAALDRLGAELGDELLATAVGRGGNVESAMLAVVGVVSTGSEELDAGICRLALADVEGLTGLAGPAEVTVLLSDLAAVPGARAALARELAGGDEAMTWEELTPDFKGHVEQDAAYGRLFTGIILLVVMLGVGGAQLAAVLERRREFAVLSALGMGTGRIVRLLLAEAAAVGLAGAVLGTALALPLLLWVERRGIDFRSIMGSNYSFQGIVIEPVIYGEMGSWIVPWAILVSLGATFIATAWPAWFAARTDPAEALRSLP